MNKKLKQLLILLHNEMCKISYLSEKEQSFSVKRSKAEHKAVELIKQIKELENDI